MILESAFKTVLFFFSLCIMSITARNGQQNRNLAEYQVLPQYLGIGYNILYGNPFTAVYNDGGIRQSPFNFSYSLNKSTADLKFSIPDFANLASSTNCSTKSYVIRGTESFQQQLLDFAKISTGKSLNASQFSMSPKWQSIIDSTITTKQSIVHVYLSCQKYKLSVNQSAVASVLKGQFISDVLSAYVSTQWSTFISKYGSHYMSEVVMGGRVARQSTFSPNAVQILRSLGIDIQTVGQAQFAQYYNLKDQFNYQRHKQGLQYASKLSFTTESTYVGSQPTSSGVLSEWQTTIGNNPWPINFTLTSLGDLFYYVPPTSTFNAYLAKQQFQNSLATLCSTSVTCPPTYRDLLEPPAAYQYYTRTKQYGTLEGEKFNQMVNSPFSQLKRIYVRHGRQINGLQLYFSDDTISQYLPAIGGDGGIAASWEIPLGEKITTILVRSGTRVNSLKFITNMGTQSPIFGGNSGKVQTLSINPNQTIIGYYGEFGDRVHKLGFLIGSIIYPEHSFEQFFNSTRNQLTSVDITYNSQYVTKLKFTISDGLTSNSTSYVGILNALQTSWAVPVNQTVNRIQYRCSQYLNSLTFITNKGTRSTQYGSSFGNYNMMKIPDGKRIVGFYGSYSTYAINRLGFILSTLSYPNQNDKTVEQSILTYEALIC